MAKEWTASQMGRKGGKARAARFGKRQIIAWGKMGGRPRSLDNEALVEVEAMLAGGMTQAEIARRLGISTRTVVRYRQRLRGVKNSR